MRIAVVGGLGAIVAVTLEERGHDADVRTVIRENVARFHYDERRADLVRTVEVQPSADLGVDVFADFVLEDAFGSFDLTSANQRQAELALEAARRLDEELAAVHPLLLRAIANRPLWSEHKARFGMIQYVMSRRAENRGGPRDDSWFVPLADSIRESPGSEGPPSFVAGVLLENWDTLTPAVRREAPRTMARAFQEPTTVEAYFAAAVEALGFDAAVRALPNDPRAIRSACEVMKEGGDLPLTAELWRRWEGAERARRRIDLAALKESFNSQDSAGLRNWCWRWAREHPVTDFDDAEARSQAATVLDLWPPERGVWIRDLRTQFVLFFLDNRTGAVDGETIDRTVESLSEVPDSVRARAKLLAGDEYEARRIATSSSTAGSFEWTDFYVELARKKLEERRLDDANAALAQIAPAARSECDPQILEARLRGRDARSEQGALIAGSHLQLCAVDPTVAVTLKVLAVTPTLVSIWRDGGKLERKLLPAGSNEFLVPLAGGSAHHVLQVKSEVGEPVSILSAELK